jgi:hypothetical protein
MNKKQLIEFRGEVDKVIEERKALGDFDANSKYMVFLLGNMRALIDHAISQQPKPEKRIFPLVPPMGPKPEKK